MARIVRARFVVERNYAGWRLDAYLQQKLRRLEPGKAAFLIAERLDAEDGRVVGPDTLLEPGFAFSLWREAEPEPETPMAFGVVFDDGELLVIDKPAGLPIHPTARYFEHTFTALARARFPDRKVDPAHRIDRETSGLVACGTAPELTGRLKRAFAEGRVAKSYLALCHGWPRDDAFEVDAPLALTLQSEVRVRMHVHAQGAASATGFAVLGRRLTADGARVALLSCQPRTGRQHQNPGPPAPRRPAAGGRQDLRPGRADLRPLHEEGDDRRRPGHAPPRPAGAARLEAGAPAPAQRRAGVVRGAAGGRPGGVLGGVRMSSSGLAPPAGRGALAVIFTSLRTPGDDGYAQTADEMVRLAGEQDGFLGEESASDASGLGLTASSWRDEAALRGWREQADHLAARAAGKARWYRAYRIRVCRVEREYGFERSSRRLDRTWSPRVGRSLYPSRPLPRSAARAALAMRPRCFTESA